MVPRLVDPQPFLMEYVIYIYGMKMGWGGMGAPERVTTVSQGVSVTNEIGLIAINGCMTTFDAHPARLEVPREKMVQQIQWIFLSTSLHSFI